MLGRSPALPNATERINNASNRIILLYTWGVNILPANPEHVADIARLAEVVWRAHYPGIISHEQIDYMLRKMYDLDVLRREMAEGITYLRALEGDRLLGFASYGPAGEEVKLHKLYVDPRHQRRAVGRGLLDHVGHA